MNSCAILAELSRFPRIFVTISYLNRDWLVEHYNWRIFLMKPHESPRIRKKSIRGESGDSWPVWNRGISYLWIVEYHRMGWKFYNSPRIQPNPNIYRFLMIRGIHGLFGIRGFNVKSTPNACTNRARINKNTWLFLTIRGIFSHDKKAQSVIPGHQFQNECFSYSSCSIAPTTWVSKTAA